MHKILLSEDDPGGGDSKPSAENQNAPSLPSTAAAPSNPPAAETVIKGTKTERELALEMELEAERNDRKKEQTRISELEDKNRQLKQVPQELKQVPQEKPKTKKYKGAAFDALGWND